MTKLGVFSRRSKSIGRRFVALIGAGEGPIVMFRSENARIRISGLIGNGYVDVSVDNSSFLRLDANGVHAIPGGQSAKVTSDGAPNVLCEILTEH